MIETLGKMIVSGQDAEEIKRLKEERERLKIEVRITRLDMNIDC